MRKIQVHLSIGYPAATHDGELEVDDDATDDHIEEIVNEWAWEHIQIWHRELS